jgi:hypothetical protein
MSSKKNLADILEKFHVSLQQSEKWVSLTEKLRQHAESIRKVQGIESNAILTQGNTALFLQLLADSQQTPIQYQDVLRTEFNTQHDILLRFEAGRCAIVSTLFPSPCIVTNIIDDEQSEGCILQVSEFFNIIKVIKIFGGKRVTMEKEKPITKAQPLSTRRRWTHGNNRY